MRHIDAVIVRNKLAGGSFFDKRTVCYFKNKVLPTMYGGKYFISYDVNEDGEKLYMVREVLDSGLIGRALDGDVFLTKREAVDAIRTLLGDAVLA